MIAIVSGTNRPGAMTYQLALFYQQQLLTHQQQSHILDLDALPPDFTVSALYQNNGKNEAFNQFVTHIKSATKVVFIVPEYNGSFPGVLKAFIDGMPYPNALKTKKIALVGLSAGTQGAALAMSHLTDILNYLGAYVYPLKVRLPHFQEYFQDGHIQNPSYQQLIEEQQIGFLQF
ncbi:MAG: NADPH-dependent FMN reductase [Bernardetiaceae bacterium]